MVGMKKRGKDMMNMRGGGMAMTKSMRGGGMAKKGKKITIFWKKIPNFFLKFKFFIDFGFGISSGSENIM